jgi:hypothetical protein
LPLHRSRIGIADAQGVAQHAKGAVPLDLTPPGPKDRKTQVLTTTQRGVHQSRLTDSGVTLDDEDRTGATVCRFKHSGQCVQFRGTS